MSTHQEDPNDRIGELLLIFFIFLVIILYYAGRT